MREMTFCWKTQKAPLSNLIWKFQATYQVQQKKLTDVYIIILKTTPFKIEYI